MSSIERAKVKIGVANLLFSIKQGVSEVCDEF